MASGLYLPEDDPNVVNAKLDFDPIDQFLWARLNYAIKGSEPLFPRRSYTLAVLPIGKRALTPLSFGPDGIITFKRKYL
jgi:hypothetical protein